MGYCSGGRGHDRIFVLNDPVNFFDPSGLRGFLGGISPGDIVAGAAASIVSGIQAAGNVISDAINNITPDKINTTGISAGLEYEYTHYSKDNGFYNCPTGDVNLTSAAIGGGVKFLWNTPLVWDDSWNVEYEVGPMEYLGLVYNPSTGDMGFTIGASISFPGVNVSTPTGINTNILP